LDYLVGANYSSDEVFDQLQYQFGDATTSTVGPYFLPQTGNYTQQDTDAWAIFGRAEWAFTDNLTFEAGARYTKAVRDFEGCSLDINAPFTTHEAFNFLQSIFRTDGGYDPIGPGECWTFNKDFIPYGKNRVTDELSEDNVSWRTGLSYRAPGNGLIYGNISKGYKGGSYTTGASTQDIQYAPVTQESILAYEIGIKQPFSDNRLQFNGATFYYDYTDKQLHGRVLDQVFGPLDTLVQIPESRVWGFEAQLVGRPIANYTFNVAATYLDTEITEFTGYNATGVTQDYAGSRFPYAPKWQIVADNEYEFPLRSGFNGFVGGSLLYNSDTNGSIGYPKDFTIDAYTLVDLRAGIKSSDDKWRASIWAKNVFDEYYWTNAVLFNDVQLRFAGQPATFGVSYSYRFQ
jgi:outer membrane receptor protein involved in Fe transport